MIVRPEPGASATVERAKAMRIDAFAMPLFAVEPVEWAVPDPLEFDALLLTSANAVRHGGPGLEPLRGLPVYAVGEATAAAAHDADFTGASVGDGGLERLLGAIPPDLRLLHLCGEHRAPAPAGRAITAVPVYRSDPVPMPDGFERIERQTVAIHSPRAGSRLGELVDEAGIARNTIRIAAISRAAAEAAGGGWERCESVESPDETALLALAARLCDNRLDR